VRDVDANPSFRDDLIELGYRSTPVTFFGDRAVVGFDRARLEKLVREWR